MRKLSLSILLILILVSMTGCNILFQRQNDDDPTAASPDESSGDTSETTERPEGWSEETHSNDVEPDYNTVFPQDEVNRIDIIISAENWETMLVDMTGLMGEFGAGEGVGGGRRGDFQPGDDAIPEGNLPGQPGSDADDEEIPEGPQQDVQRPEDEDRQPQWNNPQDRQGDGGMMVGGSDDENPVWVTATIEFEDITWEYVGGSV